MKTLQYSRQNESGAGLPYAVKTAEMSSSWSDQALESINSGLIVIDQNYTVKVWNRFMANHSKIPPEEILNQNLIEPFKELEDDWFKSKCQLSFALNQGVYITSSLSKEKVANRINTSVRNLTRKLSEVNLTFNQLVDSIRQEKAISLLKQIDICFAEIAYQLGFVDVNSFIRAFRRWTGVTPGQYRKALQPDDADAPKNVV